jgi:hypothetical protein
MIPVTYKIDLSGPFFTRDPGKTVRANIRDMLDALADEAQAGVRSQIEAQRGSMTRYSGWTTKHTIARTRSELARGGRRWGLHMVVSANTDGMSRADAIRTKAAAVSIERRWHPYRRIASALRRARAFFTADITKGLQ